MEEIQVKLVIAGGCRDNSDHQRVDFLQNYARGNFKFEPEVDIEWHINIPFSKLLEQFQVHFWHKLSISLLPSELVDRASYNVERAFRHISGGRDGSGCYHGEFNK